MNNTTYILTKEPDGYYLTAPRGAKQLVLTNEEAAELGLRISADVVKFVQDTRIMLWSFQIVEG